MGRPFQSNGVTVTMAATTTSSATTALPSNSTQVRIHAVGPNLCFIRFAGSSPTALVAEDMPLPVGWTGVITKGGATCAAVICGTGTSTVYLTPGEGES